MFVDVREAPPFGQGHIPAAVNLDLSSILSKDSLLQVAAKDDEIVFSCFGRYCPHSAYACTKAIIWGFARVYYFAGGFPAWKAAGYPVETTPPGGF